jgi:hypothetical protein
MPPPEQWVLCKLYEMEAAEIIEHHIDFHKEDEHGDRRPVHLPMSFVRHYMRRHDSVLPTAYAVATLPLVLADGGLLATTGFDRLRGIQFLIQPELRAMVPSPEDCTPEAVKEAMEFLCDEWLVDVATDGVGKAVLIAAALTLIERTLMDERPCFFVTAGKRGPGKTTLITMLIRASSASCPRRRRGRRMRTSGARRCWLFHSRGDVCPVGQHPARHADLVSAYRAPAPHPGIPTACSVFRKTLPRPRRYPPLHQRHRTEGRPGLAQPYDTSGGRSRRP